jgi:hypothetical protein
MMPPLEKVPTKLNSFSRVWLEPFLKATIYEFNPSHREELQKSLLRIEKLDTNYDIFYTDENNKRKLYINLPIIPYYGKIKFFHQA